MTALGVVITLLLFWKIHGDEIDNFQNQFEKEASSRVLFIQNRMESCLLVMESLKQLFNASELVEPHEFKTFTLPFLNEIWEISAIGWVRCLTGGQRDEAGKPGRSALGRNHDVTEVSPQKAQGLPEGHGHGHPFVFIEPADGRFRELSGVDLDTLPGGLPAIDKTRKTGKTVLLRNLHMRDGTRFDLLLEPVYRVRHDEGATPRDRDAPEGFIAIVLEPEVIIESFQKSIGPEWLSMTIEDISERNGKAKALAPGSPPVAGLGASLFQPAPPVFLQKVAFADRTMEFRLTPGREYMSRYSPLFSWLVLPAGLIFSLMMGLYIHSVMSQRQVLEHLVKERTAELQKSEEKYRLLVENANEAILVAQEGNFRFLNARTAELLGMDTEVLLSRPFIEHIHPEDRAMVMERHSKRLRGEDVPGTYSFRAITGHQQIIWAEISSVLITWEGRPAALAFITDITERKSKEDALKERDAFFARLTSQVPGMLFQFVRRPDGTYHVPFCNDGIRELFGCSPDDVRDSFDPLLKMVLPEDRERMVRSVEESADGLLPWSCEFRVQVPGKPVRWVRGDSIPERMADGSIVWSGYDTDITERKLAEENLRVSEEKFALAFRNSPTILAIVSLSNGRFIDVNDSFLLLHGYSRDEIIGRSSYELELLADSSLVKAIPMKIRESEIIKDWEVELRSKGGRAFWGLLSAVPITLMGEPCVLSQIIDITERRHLEQQLAQVQKMESSAPWRAASPTTSTTYCPRCWATRASPG